MKQKIRLGATFLVVALVVSFFIPAPSAAAQDKTVRWKVQTPYPLAVPYVARTAKMGDRIKAMTGGRFDLKFYPPGGIVPAYSEWDALQKGTLDGGFMTPSDVRGIFGPVGDLFNQYPMGPTAIETVSWMLYGNGEKLLREVMDKIGFKDVVFVGPANLSVAEDEIWTNKKIEKPSDFKGLKVRTFGYWGQILQGVGASVVTLPGGELYQALERGVIDACEYGTSADNLAIHLNEVTKYCYYPGVHSPGNVHYIFVNKKSWEKLTPDLRELLKRETLATAMDNFAAGAVESAQARETMRAKGTQFLPLNMEMQVFIAQKSEELWNTFVAKDPVYAKVYKDQKEFLAKYRSLMGEIQPDFTKIYEAMKKK
jgi:TRAP-type mannitol/chloroaromatic compound transport system substrate-binding protein